MELLWNHDCQGKIKVLEKTCPSSALSITNPTLMALRLNVDLHSKEVAAKYLRYGMAIVCDWSAVCNVCIQIFALHEDSPLESVKLFVG